MTLLQQIKEKAKKNLKTIVLPEGEEIRILKATDILIAEKIVKIILIGNKVKINKLAEENNLSNIKDAIITNFDECTNKEKYSDLMVELRKHKGLTKADALEQLKNPYYLSTIMIKAGDADGMVAGSICSTADTIRPAFQYIKTLPGINIVSGAFIMVLNDKSFGENGLMVFADCAVL